MNEPKSVLAMTRRALLQSALPILVAATGTPAAARSFRGSLPANPFPPSPPTPVDPRGWVFFSAEEARLVEAIVDRLIPEDEVGPGAKACGCAVFIDRQLAGSFGSSSRLYTEGPFLPGLPTQGWQGAANPAQRYRAALVAMNTHIRRETGGRTFLDLTEAQQTDFLKRMEAGDIAHPDIDMRQFFNLILGNTIEGYFADPIYGGNRDMAAWRMIGFPGARYDYRDHVARHGETYPHPPVSIAGSSEWNRR